MIRVLQASHNGELYQRAIGSVDDIPELIREENLETLTSSDGCIDFWFTPCTHPFHRRINRKATAIYLATTRFTPRTVPLMRGIVVLTAHDTEGTPASLTEAQIRTLADHATNTSWRQDLILSRRYNREQKIE